jgi:hypothetical protein
MTSTTRWSQELQSAAERQERSPSHWIGEAWELLGPAAILRLRWASARSALSAPLKRALEETLEPGSLHWLARR